MENPAQDIKHVIKTLAHGSPEEQHDAIYRYFAPGATFEHPFCRVPSFKNLHVPGVGVFDSRALITAIYRWYKILSPKIDMEIESCVLDEDHDIAYIKIFQIFSIWFIPLHRAPVCLVTVLHLTPAVQEGATTPPPPYDAAKEKLHAVQEGAEPSYAAVVATGDVASAAEASAHQHHQQHHHHEGEGGGAKEHHKRRAEKYQIKRQEDLYQVNEFLKFVSMSPGAAMAGFFQLLSTFACLFGAIMLGPFMKAIWPAKAASGKDKES